jgi:hypothetical protein
MVKHASSKSDNQVEDRLDDTAVTAPQLGVKLSLIAARDANPLLKRIKQWLLDSREYRFWPSALFGALAGAAIPAPLLLEPYLHTQAAESYFEWRLSFISVALVIILFGPLLLRLTPREAAQRALAFLGLGLLTELIRDLLSYLGY